MSNAASTDTSSTSPTSSESSSQNDSEFREITFGDSKSNPAEGSSASTSDDKVDGQKAGDEDDGGKSVPTTAGSGGEQPPKKKDSYQERIDALTRARHEAERTAQYWQARAQALTKTEKPQAPPERPKRESFATQEEYEDALITHRAGEVVQRTREEEAQRQEQETAAQAAAAAAAEWNAKIDKARAEIPDFDSIMETADIPVSPHVAKLLTELDEGPALMVHFARNPDQLTDLNGLSSAKVAIKIGDMIRAGLDIPSAGGGDSTSTDGEQDGAEPPATRPAPTTLKQQVPARKVSSAPAPARPAAGRSATTQKDLGSMSMEEYVAARKQQGASWAR